MTAAVFAGGIIRNLVERKAKQAPHEKAVDKGILLASGIVAGDALMGIAVGLFAALQINIAFGIKLFPAMAKNSLLALVMFVLLGGWMYWYSLRRVKS